MANNRPFTRLDLERKIKEIFGIEKITHLIDTQITRFVRDKGWSFKDIAIALIYYYVEKDGDISKGHGGIGIVPYIMDEAQTWFKAEARRQAEQIEASEAYKDRLTYDIICTKTIKRKKITIPRIDIASIKEENDD